MKWVIDASVAAKWLAPEPDTPLAEALLADDLIAPDLLYAEVANILWKKQLRGEMDVSYELAQQDAQALLQFLGHSGVIDVALEALPAPRCAPTPLEGVEPIVAPHAGVLVFLKQLGDVVEAGEAIADLIDPVSGAVSTLRPTVPGVFFARTAHRHLLRGMAVGKIAGAKAFRAGKLLSS